MKWQGVKDMFREQVGEVTFVEMFNDEDGKPRGCGILEFASAEMAKRATEKMHRWVGRIEKTHTCLRFKIVNQVCSWFSVISWNIWLSLHYI